MQHFSSLKCCLKLFTGNCSSGVAFAFIGRWSVLVYEDPALGEKKPSASVSSCCLYIHPLYSVST